jgi:multisubunit Na+/H+ antiporter MnhF subunit
MMNPLLMIGIAMIITAEKILPRPEVVARIVGIVTLVAGIIVTVRQSLGA